MELEPLDGPPEEIVEDDGGGPVKTFLEHLEDLRWMLIKSVSAILIAMLVCLVASDKLVAFLTWPLDQAMVAMKKLHVGTQVPLAMGTNVIGHINISEMGLPWDTNILNKLKAVSLVPVQSGSNLVLALQPTLKDPEESKKALVTLKNYTPIDGLSVAMELALYGGLVIASPFVFYFIGQFVLPALKVKEKKLLFRAIGFGAGLFLLGVAVCYLALSAVALAATVEFSKWMGFEADEWRADAYISFMCKFMLAMGASFELPVVILTLVKIGLLNLKTLNAWRSYAVVINLVVAAVVTPSGDPFTMVLFALPMQFLYEVSVLVAWYWERRDRKRAREAGLTQE